MLAGKAEAAGHVHAALHFQGQKRRDGATASECMQQPCLLCLFAPKISLRAPCCLPATCWRLQLHNSLTSSFDLDLASSFESLPHPLHHAAIGRDCVRLGRCDESEAPACPSPAPAFTPSWLPRGKQHSVAAAHALGPPGKGHRGW